MGAFALSLLASCGGGSVDPNAAQEPDDGSPPSGTDPNAPIDPEVAQRLADGSSPAETGRELLLRAGGILNQSDSLLISDTSAHSADGTNSFVLSPECSDVRCTLSLNGNQVDMFDRDRLRTTLGEVVNTIPVLTRNGITLAEARSANATIFGSALRNSIFITGWRSSANAQGVEFIYRRAVAAGDLTGTRPAVSGTWTGLMTGIQRSSSGFLTGDATLTLTVSGTGESSLSAEFTNINDVSRNRAHTVTTASFSQIPVSSDGSFDSGASENRIQGGFFGAEHAEASGIFEKSGIFGSFGTSRSP